MIRKGLGRWAGALALAAAACVCMPRASAAQTWSPQTWMGAAAWSDLGEAGLRSGGSSVLRLSESEKQPPAVPTRRGPVIRRMRPNTISLGLQAQYGGIRGSSRLADGFDHGAGYAFRFRYMLSPKTALGFSFEHQRFGSIQPPLNVPGDFADSHLVVTTISAEAVFYHHREKESHPYLLVGFGYASPDIIYTEDIAARANEGVFLTGGVGFERFIRPRFSIDGSLRLYGEIANSEFTSMGQVGLGIHVYPGD
ncbi:MAG TPA: hypothetical protein VFS09_05795 [Candidatus Eisenbacteria bacterium]|nr:hypothetical protein [Candidatus Eisenbacteria bacterium]